jgi:outer membrane protein OmpA-like peptidoglycan-associated protein
MRRLIAVITLLWTGAASAQDIKGAGDHPLIGRYQGSSINFYKQTDYAETVLPKAAIPAGPGEAPAAALQPAKGKLTLIRYKGPTGRSALEIVRNFEQSMAAQGFKPVFGCRAAACGSGFKFSKSARGEIEMIDDYASMTYALMKLDRAQGAVWASVFAVEQAGSGGAPATPFTAVRVVEEKAIETGKVELIKADKIAQGIAANGRVALYAVEFDLDKDTLRPTSAPQIAEVVAFLKANPSVSVMIVGHTDTSGAFDYNRSLSERRAGTVVKALAAQGVVASRLTAFGAGPAAPVATNRTEDGRAKNRRVEIVDYPKAK